MRRNDFRSFAGALAGDGGRTLSLIAEVKRASPSAGVIAEDFDPVEIARRYEAAGANAVSVLTDERFFQGHLDHLVAVREAIGLPVLRKDFVLEDVQIYEAAASGADAVLLIVAACWIRMSLERLLDVAAACQLDALVEVHTLEEMDRALATDATIIGINNRDLTTFQVDLATTELPQRTGPARRFAGQRKRRAHGGRQSPGAGVRRGRHPRRRGSHAQRRRGTRLNKLAAELKAFKQGGIALRP